MNASVIAATRLLIYWSKRDIDYPILGYHFEVYCVIRMTDIQSHFFKLDKFNQL